MLVWDGIPKENYLLSKPQERKGFVIWHQFDFT
jgi:hypothetical protein